LPAVQAAREAARQAQCKNNVKQLALGCLNHENQTGRFPTDGWGWQWTGDADRGNDWRQPGGWIYNVLPYIEQQSLHDMGLGLPDSNTPSSLKGQANMQRMSTPISVVYCPTRRQPLAYPWYEGATGFEPVNAAPPRVTCKSDYAANGGDYCTGPASPAVPGAPFWGQVGNQDSGPPSTTSVENPPGQMTGAARAEFNFVGKYATGIVFVGSMVRMCDVTDGASSTYLLGEKYINPDYYVNGNDEGDNETAFAGDNGDVSRWTGWGGQGTWLPPWPDTPGVGAPPGSHAPHLSPNFGSAHANGVQMAFCDGSVQIIAFTIDQEVHRLLGNRADGMAIDGKAL
jgi:prepilin-type processing-associated H-X9-DG protein